MSKSLLNFLNANKSVELKKIIESKEKINIAWYPSAGRDFRSLMYLSPQYSKYNPALQKENIFPDIFIFTDYFPWENSDFLDSPIIHSDTKTIVKVEQIEELQSLNLPLDRGIIGITKGSSATGKVVFMKVHIQSNTLGELSYPVIYAFVENEAFCSQILLKHNSEISHIIHVRYGGGCGGGGYATGVWLLNVLKKLHTKIFITDGHLNEQSGDREAYKLYPNLRGTPAEMETIRTLDEILWSNHGNITWNIVKNK